MTIDAAKQRILQDFVNREVICCLSSAVYQLGEQLKENAALSEQIMDLSSKQNYLSALEEEGWGWEDGSLINESIGEHWDGDYVLDIDPDGCHIFDEDEEQGAEQSLCNELGIDPHEEEVFEYWAVSEWLGKKLKEQDELVDDDFLGLCVWGRTTTGQSISMDGVIEVIYDNLHK